MSMWWRPGDPPTPMTRALSRVLEEHRAAITEAVVAACERRHGVIVMPTHILARCARASDTSSAFELLREVERQKLTTLIAPMPLLACAQLVVWAGEPDPIGLIVDVLVATERPRGVAVLVAIVDTPSGVETVVTTGHIERVAAKGGVS